MENDFDTDGYFGKQVADFRQELIEYFREFFDIAFELNRFVQKEKINFNFENNQQHAVIGSILCRIINSYQATILLITYNLLTEAEVVLRSLMEATFLITACCNNEIFYDKFLKTHNAHRLLLLRNIHKKNLIPSLKEYIPYDDYEQLELICKEENTFII